MTTLVTPREVIDLAFADGGYLPPEAIGTVDIAAAEARYLPVSYTHLDVYKRQSQHTVTVTSDITAEALTYNAIGGEELTLFRLNTRSFPVSYTHLDRYIMCRLRKIGKGWTRWVP